MDELKTVEAAYVDGDYLTIERVVKSLINGLDLMHAGEKQLTADLAAVTKERDAARDRRMKISIKEPVWFRQNLKRARRERDALAVVAKERIDRAVETTFENVSGVWCLSPDDPERPALIRWLRKSLYQEFDVTVQEGQG